MLKGNDFILAASEAATSNGPNSTAAAQNVFKF